MYNQSESLRVFFLGCYKLTLIFLMENRYSSLFLFSYTCSSCLMPGIIGLIPEKYPLIFHWNVKLTKTIKKQHAGFIYVLQNCSELHLFGFPVCCSWKFSSVLSCSGSKTSFPHSSMTEGALLSHSAVCIRH